MEDVVEIIDTSKFDAYVAKASDYIEREELAAERLSESASFKLVWVARKYDEWFLDPIVGFIIPGVGDLISSAATLPAVYVALVKLHSIKLTLAIIGAMITDFLAGLIPVVGDVVDAFYRSSKLSSRLIVGYVEQDPDTIEEVNKRAIWSAIGLIALCLIGWFFYNLVVGIYHFIVGLF